MKGKTLLAKNIKVGSPDVFEDMGLDMEYTKRTCKGKKPSTVRSKMKAASRKVRYEGKHIDIDKED